MGAAVALPFLDAMVPAFTALARLNFAVGINDLWVAADGKK